MKKSKPVITIISILLLLATLFIVVFMWPHEYLIITDGKGHYRIKEKYGLSSRTLYTTYNSIFEATDQIKAWQDEEDTKWKLVASGPGTD